MDDVSNLLGVYAVYDVKAEIYNAPFFMAKHAMAVRAFSDLANDRNTTVGRHPGDFKLVHLGFFSPVTGAFKTLEMVESLGFADAFVRKEESRGLS